MAIKYFELNDDRCLGVAAAEVAAFPDGDSLDAQAEGSGAYMARAFTQLLTELYKLGGGNTCLELLWVTEKAVNQAFASRIRIFAILRKIGQRPQLEHELGVLLSSLSVTLTALHFEVQEADVAGEGLGALLGSVDGSCVYGIVKSEKYSANAASPYPYYYTDVVPNRNETNFNALIAALSQQQNCCISVQVFPTQLTPGEQYLINEVAAELGRVSAGVMMNQQFYRDASAQEPLKVYAYYNERRAAPMFLYNILAFGERTCCASLATRLVSLLQSGQEPIASADFACIDLSGEAISLPKQFSYYPWNINNRLLYAYRNSRLQAAIPAAKALFRLPCLMTAEEAAAVFRLPVHQPDMAALKCNKTKQVQEQFAAAVVDENNICLGTLKANDTAAIKIGCPEKIFTKHALVVGTPGSGKTTFSVNLLLQFAHRGIPFLAIEPTKTEYRAMIDALPDLRIFTPGNNAVSPFIINPFVPPRDISVEQFIPSLTSAFKAAFSMPSPLDMIFLKAVRTCYIQYGWKDYSKAGDPDVHPFGLHEFILVFKQLLQNTNYSSEVRGNLESAGLLRLSNLIEQNSNIYDTINTVPIEDLLTAPTVLELNSIDNAEQKALIMALLLINVCLYTKHNQVGDGKLKNIILIDEAHVLLGGGAAGGGDGSPDAQAATVKALQDMIAEIRSYGTGIIIADQSPTKVSREVVANTDIKVTFRLVQSAEKALIADSTNMDELTVDELSRLKPGEAYVYYSMMESPQPVMTEDIREKEGIRLSVPNSEIAARTTYWNSHSELLRPYPQCTYCQQCDRTCDFAVRANAEYIANSALQRYRASIKTEEALKKFIYNLPTLMAEQFKQYEEPKRRQLQICSRIKVYRKVTLELPLHLSDAEQKRLIGQLFPATTDSNSGKDVNDHV